MLNLCFTFVRHWCPHFQESPKLRMSYGVVGCKKSRDRHAPRTGPSPRERHTHRFTTATSKGEISSRPSILVNLIQVEHHRCSLPNPTILLLSNHTCMQTPLNPLVVCMTAPLSSQLSRAKIDFPLSIACRTHWKR